MSSIDIYGVYSNGRIEFCVNGSYGSHATSLTLDEAKVKLQELQEAIADVECYSPSMTEEERKVRLQLASELAKLGEDSAAHYIKQTIEENQ